ncbi:hypothetical protein AA637_12360 [Cyanobacterium sp. HL-69]|uniref:matrixin family metalloprotease n=1 Tax=Cyanobacterium sp. HL-69 TaxID=2054282 RepID=UPI000CA3310F|nr:hypothetical protein AA637_12360 [Cyanobacterium sp. HL-69]
MKFITNIKNFFSRFLLTIFILIIFSELVTASDITNRLPTPHTFPLPPSLASLNIDIKEDYFDNLEPHLVGHLIWSEFPVKVYIAPPENNLSESAYQRYQQWEKAAQSAIASWHPYIPLQIVETEVGADILIRRQRPQIREKFNPETGLFDLPRITSATATVQFYATETQPAKLKHQMIIEVSPHQTFDYWVNNITHELGHALGIWGHSPHQGDMMYHAQTRNIPTISPRDLNTLVKVYQQPTRLGGAFPPSSSVTR